mgnify:CR=1 FL=1
MKVMLYIFSVISALMVAAFLFRYEYTESKQARVDKFTQKYEINCQRKHAYMEVAECIKLTPEEMIEAEKRREEAESREVEIKKINEAKVVEQKKACQEMLDKARLDYISEKNIDPNSKITDFKKSIYTQYGGLCK